MRLTADTWMPARKASPMATPAKSSRAADETAPPADAKPKKAKLSTDPAWSALKERMCDHLLLAVDAVIDAKATAGQTYRLADLCRDLGISQSNINGYREYKFFPTHLIIIRMCDLFGFSPAFFYYGQDFRDRIPANSLSRLTGNRN